MLDLEERERVDDRSQHLASNTGIKAPRLGERFDGVVTGASEKGTWARILRPPVEGRVVRGAEGLEVGDKVSVKLVSTDVERGYIDFVRV